MPQLRPGVVEDLAIATLCLGRAASEACAIAAEIPRDARPAGARCALAGIVKTANPLTVQARGNVVWTVDDAAVKSIHQYADDSSNFAKAKPAQLTDLRPGDQFADLRVAFAAKGAEGDIGAASHEVFFGWGDRKSVV